MVNCGSHLIILRVSTSLCTVPTALSYYGRNNIRKGNVDADLIVYTMGSVTDRRHYLHLGERYSTQKELLKAYPHLNIKDFPLQKDPMDWDEAKVATVSYLEDILEYFHDYQLFLSGKTNFRYKVATIQPYKGNRSDKDRPFHYDNIRQFLVDVYGAELSTGIEADDVLGLAQSDDTTLCSIDKDLDVVPGHHYNWQTNCFYYLSKEESLRNYFKQLLTGDSTDNILGLFGVGPKSAMCKAIDKMSDDRQMYDLVLAEYTKRFGSYAKQFLEETSKLVWIMQRRANPVLEYING